MAPAARLGSTVLLVLGPALAACLVPLPAVPPPAGDGFSATGVFPGAYDGSGPFSRVLVAGPLGVLPDEFLSVPSPVDGAALRLAIVRPDTSEPVPVLLWASPYFAPALDGHAAAADLVAATQPTAFLIENFVPHGYAVALLALRGTGGSGGCSEFGGKTETADLGHVIDLLANQPWSTGAVGMIGLSYEGMAAWQAASTGNPHLRTIVPLAGISDFEAFYYRNGTGFASGPGFPILAAHRPDYAAPSTCPEAAEGAAALAARQAGLPDPTGWFAERGYRARVESAYHGSVFAVHSLRDQQARPRNTYPWIHALEERGTPVKHLLGQWSHVEWPDHDHATRRLDFAEILLRWFDHELKGRPVDLGARVQVADSSGAWRSEAAWPPADAAPRILGLSADGQLAEGDAGPAGTTPLAPDPPSLLLNGRALAASAGAAVPCATCVPFATDPLPSELRLVGLPQAHLTLTPLGPGGHVTAVLRVENATASRAVGWAQMDLRYAAGPTPRPVVPGQPLLAPLEFEPLDVVVAAGSRLVLVLSQGGYGGSGATPTVLYQSGSVPTFPLLLHTGAGGSLLRFSVIERPEGDSAFFAPPTGRSE